MPQFRKQILVARIDRAGNLIWQKQFGTEHNEEGVVAKILNDEIFIAGNKVHYLTGISQGFLMRVNLQGDSLDFYTYTASNNLVVHDITIDNNLIYVAGEHYLSTPTLAKSYLSCLNTNGNLVWQRSYGNDEVSQNYKKIFIKDNGRILVVGTTKNLVGSNFTNISVVEMNSIGSPSGGAVIISDSDQTFGNAIFSGNNLVVLSSTTQGATVNSRLTSVNTSNTIDWQLSLAFSGQGTALSQFDANTILIASESSNLVNFHSIHILDGSVQESTELKNFPGDVKSMINTKDNGVIAIGTTSPEYGTMVRLIKTDAELYLLKP
jgi:hypothetical protein